MINLKDCTVNLSRAEGYSVEDSLDHRNAAYTALGTLHSVIQSNHLHLSISIYLSDSIPALP